MAKPLRKVGVFIDYQNAYMGARETFHDKVNDPSRFGQFSPVDLGELLASFKAGRVLRGVHLYRGMPNGVHQPKPHAATRRQIAAWKAADPRVTVTTRPLRYRWESGRPIPREKGVDVQLALDFVELLAFEKRYDVGIIVSADSDLAPAIEMAWRVRPTADCETAMWWPDTGYGPALSVQSKGRKAWIHRIKRADYQGMQDTRNYAV